jgi:hypothetical protein
MRFDAKESKPSLSPRTCRLRVRFRRCGDVGRTAVAPQKADDLLQRPSRQPRAISYRGAASALTAALPQIAVRVWRGPRDLDPGNYIIGTDKEREYRLSLVNHAGFAQLISSVAEARARMPRMSAATSRRWALASAV